MNVKEIIKMKEYSKFIEAYKYANSHIFQKYKNFGIFPVIDALTFHKCCPECGTTTIAVVTGRWEKEFITKGWIFKRKKLIRNQFVESINT